MSKLVDERVVELKFDNRDFERNTRQSMSTLQKLKSSLNFSGVSSSVNNSVKSVSFDPISKGLETAGKSFSAFDAISFSVIKNLTDRVVDAGIKIVKSLSIDNIVDSWKKYEDTTISVGTLVMQGNDIEKVTEQMDLLRWYVDQTSYSFTDLMGTVSKLTAAGIPLEKAVQMVMGISNWAASLGKDARSTQNVYLQLSQAIGKGVVELQDWRSVQNANMDSSAFRKEVLKEAVTIGTLTESMESFEGEIEYVTKQGNRFTQSEFTKFMSSDDWFTSDVLANVLEKHAKAVNEIKQLTDENPDLLPNQAIKLYQDETDKLSEELDEYKKHLDNMEEGYTELEYAQKKENIELRKFSLNVFKSAQEARTFTQAIQATKDAVSSQFHLMFEQIFGNYEEATKLWTNLANKLYDIFAAPLTVLTDSLKVWRGYTDEVVEEEEKLKKEEKELNDYREKVSKNVAGYTKAELTAREALYNQHRKDWKALKKENDHYDDLFGTVNGNIGAFWNVIDAIQSFINVVKEAWHEVFPFSKSLGEITKGLQQWSAGLFEIDSEGNKVIKHSNDIKNIFKGLFSVLKLGKKILDGVMIAIKPIIKAIMGDANNFIEFLGNLSEKFANWVDETQLFADIGKKIADVFTVIIDGLKELKLIERISKAFKELNENLKISETFEKIWKTLVGTFDFLFDLFVDGLGAVIDFVGDYLVPIFSDIIKFFGGFVAVVGDVVFKAFKNIINGIKEFADTIKNNEAIQNGWKSFIEWFKSIPEKLKDLKPFFNKMAENIGKFFSVIWKGIKKFGSSLSTVVKLDKVASFFQFIGEKISLAFNTIAYAISSFASKNFSNVAKGTQKALSPLATLFQGLWDLLKGVWNVIRALIPIIGKMLSAIGNFLTWLGDSLSRTFTKDVKGTGKGINLWYLINGGVIALFLKWLYDFVFLFTGLTSGISDVIYATASMLRGKAIKSWAEAVKEVALAILLIVASLAIIASIDTGKLIKATIVLTHLIAIMAGVIVVMGVFLKQSSYEIKHSFVGFKNIFSGKGMSTTSKGTGYFGVAGMILAFGASILALVAALKVIDSIKPEDLGRDLFVLSQLIALFAGAIIGMQYLASLSKDSKENKDALKGMLSFSLGFLLLARTLKFIGSIPILDLLKGLLAITVIMAQYAGMTYIMRDFQAPAMSKFLAFSAGLLLVAAPIAILAKLDILDILKALVPLLAISTIYGVLIQLGKTMNKDSAIGMTLVIIAMTAMFTAVAFLINGPIKDMSGEDLKKFTIIALTLGVALSLVIYAISKINFAANKVKEKGKLLKTLGVFAGIFAAVAVALVAIAGVSKVFETVNWKNAAWGFGMFALVIGASIAIFAIAKEIKVDDYKGLYTKLAIFAGIVQTLIVFAAQIGIVSMIFSQVNWKNAVWGFAMFGLVLAAAVGIFAVLAKVKIDTSSYQNIMGMGLIILALSTMMVAVAILATAAKNVDAPTIAKTVGLIALSLLSVVLTAVVASKFESSINKTSIALVKLAASFALFGVGAVAFATGLKLLKNNVGMLLMFVGVMALAGIVMKILGSAAPTMLMIAIAFALIGAAALALGGGFYLIVLAVKELLPVLDELAAKSDSLETVLEAMIAGAVKGIAKAIPTITENLLTALDMLLAYGLKKLIEVKDWFMALDISKVMDVIGKLALFALAALIAVLQKVNEKIMDISKLLTEILVGTIVGAINGIANKMQDITDAVANFVISFIDALGNTFVKNAERARNAILNFAKNIWNAFLKFFGIHSPSKTTEEGGVNIVRGIGKGILKTVKEVVRIVINLGKEILKPLKELPKAFFDIGFSIIQSFLNGLKNTVLAVFDFIEDVVNRVKRFFGIGGKKESKEFADAGKDMVIKYKNGLEEGEMEVNSTAKAVINETIDILSTETGIFKEIGRTIVQYIAEGISLNGDLISYELVNMITDLFTQFNDESEDTMSELDSILDDYIQSAIDGIKTKFEEVKLSEIVNEYLSKILDVLNSELNDEDIVIRPVMDLSDIQNGTGLIAAMLSSVSGVTVASASATAERASSEISSAKQASEASQVSATSQLQTTDAQGGVYNLTFNITGNDPKAIADEVSKRFQQEISRRNLAYK